MKLDYKQLLEIQKEVEEKEIKALQRQLDYDIMIEDWEYGFLDMSDLF